MNTRRRLILYVLYLMVKCPFLYLYVMLKFHMVDCDYHFIERAKKFLSFVSFLFHLSAIFVGVLALDSL